MSTKTNKCVISFANERGRYLDGIARLGNSLKGKFDGDFLGFIGEGSLGAPPHLENPYAFKIYAFNRAYRAGYTQILWLDSSCFAIKNIQPIFDEIALNGYIMQEAGHYVGDWCNDYTLNYFGLTLSDANKMPMYGNAGFLGLDLVKTKSLEFLELWHHAMDEGCFKGPWDNHRHDMACGSIIANQLGMKYKSGNEWLEYATEETPPKNETILIKAAGL